MEINDRNREALLQKWQPVLDRVWDIGSWSSGHDLAALCEMASQAKNIVEVGSYHGKSAACMLLASPEAKILCIDVSENNRCSEILQANLEHFAKGRWDVRDETTEEVFVEWGYGDRYDFAFIDGGHLYDDVYADIKNLLPNMVPGAIMSGHDWRQDMTDGVNRAVMAHFARERISTFENVWWVRL